MLNGKLGTINRIHMITLLFGLFFTFQFLWYNCSRKVKFFDRSPWLEKLVHNRKLSRYLVLTGTVLTILGSAYMHGWGAGIFAWTVYAMGFLNLIVLIQPFRYLRARHVFLLFSICAIIEVSIKMISNNP